MVGNIAVSNLVMFSCSKGNVIGERGWQFHDYHIEGLPKIGNVGDPHGANAKLGREMMEEYVKFNVELTEEMRKIYL